MTSDIQGEELFFEEQDFGWILPIILGILTAIYLIMYFVLPLPGREPLVPSWLIAVVLVFILIKIFRMKTWVRKDGIHIRLFPFHLKPVFVSLGDFSDYSVITYNPLMDYGGWGIRWTLKGKAYNARGNRGVLLSLNNGKTLLIGSQQPEKLAEAIGEALRKGN